uniref:Uncharacterized protein n=1 Tax=Eptatretus burgeri TaxID=7764 RepID=A0A8C4QHK9_EPTBU
MSETIKEKLKNYKTAPFDARFPNQNQTRNCYQNYLGECLAHGAPRGCSVGKLSTSLLG